jgi:hypothetical protein
MNKIDVATSVASHQSVTYINNNILAKLHVWGIVACKRNVTATYTCFALTISVTFLSVD